MEGWRSLQSCFPALAIFERATFGTYQVYTPTLHQRTLEWGAQNEQPSPRYKHRHTHAHTHLLSPTGHCKLSIRVDSHNSDTGSKPLAKKRNKIKPETSHFLFPSRDKGMMEMGVEVSRHRATTLPNSRGPTPTEEL